MDSATLLIGITILINFFIGLRDLTGIVEDVKNQFQREREILRAQLSVMANKKNVLFNEAKQCVAKNLQESSSASGMKSPCLNPVSIEGLKITDVLLASVNNACSFLERLTTSSLITQCFFFVNFTAYPRVFGTAASSKPADEL